MEIIIPILALLVVSSLAFAGMSLAPWVPSRRKDLERIFRIAGLKPGETFYDIGCGNGRLVFYASKHYDVNAVGIEMAWPMYLTCVVQQFFKKNKKASFKWKNLFKENLSSADVLYVFGMPNTLRQRFTKKLVTELKPGARVISYAFHIEGWEPAKVDKPGEKDITVYLYKIPKP